MILALADPGKKARECYKEAGCIFDGAGAIRGRESEGGINRGVVEVDGKYAVFLVVKGKGMFHELQNACFASIWQVLSRRVILWNPDMSFTIANSAPVECIANTSSGHVKLYASSPITRRARLEAVSALLDFLSDF